MEAILVEEVVNVFRSKPGKLLEFEELVRGWKTLVKITQVFEVSQLLSFHGCFGYLESVLSFCGS